MFHVPFPKKSVLALSIASAIICMSNTTFAKTIENAIYEGSNTLLANNELIFTKAEAYSGFFSLFPLAFRKFP